MSYNGQLNSNEIFSAIYNMIISQDMMVPELANNYSELVNKYRVDGTLYGDTKLYYDTDVLSSRPWGNDAEAANLLNVNRPAAPECQSITLDQFRQIDITVDNYLSKRAWSTEGAFNTFNSVILSMLSQTKKIYDVTLFNVYVGTTEGGAARATVDIDVTTATTGATGLEAARLEGTAIAEGVANLIVDMKDFSRDFNDYGFMRAYNEADLVFIWNSKFLNKINKIDLPTIFHKEGLVDKFGQYVLPARYFGEVTSSDDVGSGKVLEGNAVHTGAGLPVVRSKVEKEFTVGGVDYHVFPGDAIPAGTTVGGSSAQFLYADCYKEVDDVICKVVTNKTYKYMSAFETATEFFNPRSLTANHYLTWGFSAPDRLLGQALVTVKKI